MRASSDHDRLALKAAVRLALKRVGGGDCFCHATRVGAPALSNYANANRDDSHMPLDVALDLDRDAGAPIVVGALARLNGYRLVPLQAAGSAPDLEDIATIARETGDVVSALATALVDGGVDSREAADIRREIEEANAALNRLAAKLTGPGEGS
ncbi:phage regulatory CII family protein [Oricola indica]|jgi:hypothetical protein|uniref:phage regulatory CII family protein n=1 Tax=Oricola indica TaxID=2872591 RepID=UPI001CBC693C|nr:phage regulatory CII family protein [Oricola indica]